MCNQQLAVTVSACRTEQPGFDSQDVQASLQFLTWQTFTVSLKLGISEV